MTVVLKGGDNTLFILKIQVQGRGYKTFSCSTQLSLKLIMLIKVKMPTIVGILTFICMINTTIESMKTRKVFVFTALQRL